jgi:hypothetical protein
VSAAPATDAAAPATWSPLKLALVILAAILLAPLAAIWVVASLYREGR